MLGWNWAAPAPYTIRVYIYFQNAIQISFKIMLCCVARLFVSFRTTAVEREALWRWWMCLLKSTYCYDKIYTSCVYLVHRIRTAGNAILSIVYSMSMTIWVYGVYCTVHKRQRPYARIHKYTMLRVRISISKSKINLPVWASTDLYDKQKHIIRHREN